MKRSRWGRCLGPRGRAAVAALALLWPLGGAGCAATGTQAQAQTGVARLRLDRFRGGSWDLATERGKLVLVNYFATWCAPCVAEWPLLIDLQQRHGAAGLRVVAVCMDGEGDVDALLGRFLDHFSETNFPVVMADDRTYAGDPWPIAVLPTTVIVGRDGKALGRWDAMLPEDEADAVVRDLLDGPGR